MGFELHASVKFGNGLESCNTLSYDLRADAVTGHYCKVVVPHSSIFSLQQESSAKVIIRAFEAADTTGVLSLLRKVRPASPVHFNRPEHSWSSFVALFTRVLTA
jgi:hypothetical protein